MDFQKEIFPIIETIGRKKIYPPNTIITSKENLKKEIGFIIDGVFKVSFDEINNKSLLYYLRKDNIIANMNAFKSKKAKIAISSLTSCEVIWVESKELSNLEKFHNMNVNKMMTTYYHFISQKLLENISNFFRLDFKTKLICYLKDQVEILNTNKIDLSRTEMYSDLGMSRVTLYKLLKNLEEERKLIIRIGYIEIMPSLMTFKKPK